MRSVMLVMLGLSNIIPSITEVLQGPGVKVELWGVFCQWVSYMAMEWSKSNFKSWNKIRLWIVLHRII